ncbi:MAG: DUF4252 domain-containing protein [Bacteroidota bacterium]
MKRLLCGLALVLGSVLVPNLHAQSGAYDLHADPGYVDFDRLADWFGEPARLEVNIKGALLRLVAEASRYEDPELSDMLTKVTAIQVRGFPLRRSQFETMETKADDWASTLSESGWDTIVRVRNRYEYVNMFVRTRDDAIAGMVVMVLEPGEDETIFLNIVGEIDPAQVGRIGRRFDLDLAYDSDY